MRANTIGLIAGALGVAASANAGLVIGDTITLSRIGTSGRAMNVNYDGSRAWNASGVTGGQFTIGGFINWNRELVNGAAAGGTIGAFCVEISEGFPDDPIHHGGSHRCSRRKPSGQHERQPEPDDAGSVFSVLR